MTDILTQPTPQTESEYEAALNQMFAEMHSLNEQMRRDQADIDRLKAESEAYKAENERYKQNHLHWQSEMERLRQEGASLTSETRATLNRLQTIWNSTISRKMPPESERTKNCASKI